MSYDMSLLPYEIARRYISDSTSIFSDHPLAIKAMGYVRSRFLPGLAQFADDIDWHSYSRDEVCFCRQIASFFKKNSVFSDDEKCELAAVQAFQKAELVCRISNKRLYYYDSHGDRLTAHRSSEIKSMKDTIWRVLGSFSDFLDQLPSLVRVTNGATYSKPRKRAQAHLKMHPGMQSSYGARKYLSALETEYGMIPTRLDYNCTPFNRIEFVPKNWKTFRTIACEPDGNVILQLAFDAYIKVRLKKILNIDLSKQSINQGYAVEGSLTGLLATIDMKAASDTICEAVIHTLFPDRWSSFLEDIRSRFYKTGKSCKTRLVGKFAKFSSMGNGTTFGLETLVFAAAVIAVGSQVVAVYGDDIICDTAVVDKFISLANFLGFQVNSEKSFTSGPFRESCGVDAYEGVDITPFYMRESTQRRMFLSHLCNGLLKMAVPEGELGALVVALCKDFNLPLVPWNDDSTSGVFVSPTFAIKQRLFRSFVEKRGDCQVSFRGYQAENAPNTTVRNRATAMLWYLERSRSRRASYRDLNHAWTCAPILTDLRADALSGKGIDEGKETSSVTHLLDTKPCKRKWTRWFRPSGATPLHLFWWEGLLAASAANK